MLAVGLIVMQTLSISWAEGHPDAASAGREGNAQPKISLSSDFSSPRHWERVIAFGRQHNASRIVYWGEDVRDVFLYPNYPKLLPEGAQAEVMEARERFRQVAKMTTAAGMEFWFSFQVLELPPAVAEHQPPGWIWVLRPPTVSHVQKVLPELFNPYGEPDMSGDLVYKLIGDQLEELRRLAPELRGIELTVTEAGGVQIASLAHQRLSTEGICERIVDTVYNHVAPAGLKLDVNLHTPGGDPVTRRGLLMAAMHHPQVIISADNVIGDFNPFLPFHEDLIKAAKTNPISVYFDLNGEYWGRNFVPTSALHQYAEHIEIARKLGALYLDGRVGTVHNEWSPFANVLPSRRQFYSALAKTSNAAPLPPDLDITSTDTLGAINAEFFCRRIKNPMAMPEDAVRDVLRQEFGDSAVALLPAILKLEPVLGKLFFADTNYYGFQSVLPDRAAMDLGYLSTQLTLPAGTEFPTPPIRREIAAKTGYKFAFAGWPTPLNHRCEGPEAMIRDKQEALVAAGDMLREVQQDTQRLRPSDQDFLLRLFEDLVYFARARRWLLEAQVHYYLLKDGKQIGNLPQPAQLKSAVGEIQRVADEWEARYPGGRYKMAETLRQWLKEMGPR
jgi:hypothetical protein